MIERRRRHAYAALDSLFVGDQHVSATPYYQNTPMLGRLLAEWGDAPAGCLFLLPCGTRCCAEQIGTLAAIARGRFIMQCGLGWGDARFRRYGCQHQERVLRLSRKLSTSSGACWVGETVSSSRRFRIAEASLALRPAEPVEVWIGASAPPAIDPRGTTGGGLDREPRPHPREARAQAELYRERCAAYGRQPGAIVLRRDIYVGDSSSEAQAVLQHALSRSYRGMPQKPRSRARSTKSHNSFGPSGNRLHRHPRAPSDQPISRRSWAHWNGSLRYEQA